MLGEYKQRTLLIRLGAIGDCIIVTSLIRYLKETQKEEVYFLTSEQGVEMLQHNPYVDKIIPYISNSIPDDKLDDFFEATRKAYECDRYIDLCESIEVKLALRPTSPCYNYPKWEREAKCNKNYYDFTFNIAGYPDIKGTRPELYFSKEEEDWATTFRKKYNDKIMILWGLSGSGRNKSYPYAAYVMGDIINKYKDVIIVTVGNNVCRILEESTKHPRILGFSGLWSMRKSAIMTKYADLVVSPDTGLLHAAGCFDTPKIGILGHSTIENITKYFKNDYSIEADCECAPCFKLIYNAVIQCPIDPVSRGCWCMTMGQPAERMRDRIFEVIDVIRKTRATGKTSDIATSSDGAVSCML